MKKKNLLIAGSVLLTAILIAGCSGKVEDTTEAEVTDVEVSEEAETVVEEEVAIEEVVEAEPEPETITEDNTDSVDINADEYWSEYPLSMNDKSVYVKKFEELPFNKDLTIYRDGKEITNEENYKTNGVIVFESDSCSLMFYADDNSFLNDLKEVFPNSADIENTTGQASVIYDDNNALYYYTVDNETYLYCFVTPLKGSFNPDSFNKYFDYVIK